VKRITTESKLPKRGHKRQELRCLATKELEKKSDVGFDSSSNRGKSAGSRRAVA